MHPIEEHSCFNDHLLRKFEDLLCRTPLSGQYTVPLATRFPFPWQAFLGPIDRKAPDPAYCGSRQRQKMGGAQEPTASATVRVEVRQPSNKAGDVEAPDVGPVKGSPPVQQPATPKLSYLGLFRCDGGRRCALGRPVALRSLPVQHDVIAE